LGLCRAPRAQIYPTRPVRLLVGFPPGGGSDVGARIIANRLSEVWGQQVIVENKSDAGGHLAIEIAAHATPDGYTMIGVGGAISTLRLDDQVDQLRSGSRSAAGDIGRHVPEHLGSSELLAMAVRCGSDRSGESQSGYRHVLLTRRRDITSSHGVLFARLPGIDIRHVPYRGGGPALTDLIAARVDCESAVKGKYEQLGILSGGSTPAELADRGRSEAKLWRSVMEATGIAPE
jgi:hypothetical protein